MKKYELSQRKEFSQVNLFIDDLKFMLEKNRLFKLLGVDTVFS